MSVVTKYLLPKPKHGVAKRREMFWGLLFLSPWIIGFIFFILVPLIYAFSYSLMEFNTYDPDGAHFIGFDNYRRILDDKIALRSVRVTALYVLIWAPISILVPLGFATLLHSRHLFASRYFRLAFYVPTLVSEFAVASIIRSFFSKYGWFNQLIMEPLGFSAESLASNALIAIIIFTTSLWGVGNIILILLAAKQGVPIQLYEAADVDGAGAWQKYRNITLPLITPIIFYSLIISMLGAFQIFAAPYLLGGSRFTYDENAPGMFMTLYIFRQLTVKNDIGYAASLGWVLAAISAIAAILVFFSARYWVFYGDE